MKALLFVLLVQTLGSTHGFVQSPLRRPIPCSSSSRSAPIILFAKTTKKASTARQNRIGSLMDWAKAVVDIKVASGIQLQSDVTSGLGWLARSDIPSGSVVMTVPSSVALTVEAPGSGPNDFTVLSSLLQDDQKKTFLDMPWYVQMSLYLFKLDQVDSTKGGSMDMKAWLDSLPRQFDTPIHWSSLDDLQYDYMVDSVKRQEQEWKDNHQKLIQILSSSSSKQPTWQDFLWGCECARSRAFSGTYTGSAFNPLIYVFTLLLVTIYVGVGLGTLEQAANGAGFVVSVSILKDFVFPKLLFKGNKKYVICPMIDMANHQSMGAKADVSFEYFSNAYSLATTDAVPSGEELYISYGARSNDQLLQYYGFVESDNPHDVYVMPPLRDWDITALEQAVGRTFAAGRLGKLDRAGLLGGRRMGGDDDDTANAASGVVVTRVAGVDPAVLQALRALVSTDEEWMAASEAIGNFADAASDENERCARLAAKTALEMELDSKATTIQQDEDLLKRMQNTKTTVDREDILAVQFRIEKKNLLQEVIENLN
jgi:hypothetical protein